MVRDDPPTNDVVKTILRRASSPRPDSHADNLARTAVETHGREAVSECIRLILDDGLTHRRAGAHTFGNDNYLSGITVGSAVSIYLHQGVVHES